MPPWSLRGLHIQQNDTAEKESVLQQLVILEEQLQRRNKVGHVTLVLGSRFGVNPSTQTALVENYFP